MRKIFAIIVLTAILALMVPFPVYASGLSDGKIVFGDDFTLETGQEIDGDLLMLGGSLVLEEGSVVDGDVLVMGGSVVCAGEVSGTLSVVGGNVHLQETAVVEGDLASIGGNVTRDAGAVIEGQQVTGTSLDIPDDFDFPTPPTAVDSFQRFRFSLTPVWDVMWYLFRSVIMAGLAALIVLFWPKPTRRMADTIIRQPLVVGGVGLLTFLVAPILLLLLTVTIILIPVSAVAVIVLIAAVVYGWISLGLEVGERIASAAQWDLHAVAAAALGTSLLSLVVGGVNFIPCIGWIAPFIVMVLGLGAVLLTVFGSRDYRVESAVAASGGTPAGELSTLAEEQAEDPDPGEDPQN